MCKLMIIPSVNPKFQEETWMLAQTITDKGLSGERWLDPSAAWVHRVATDKVKEMLGKAVDTTGTYNHFGKVGAQLKSLALHSRMATCGLSMINTHPHVSPDLSVGIVHNGVINNAKDFGLKYSTCDSEAFLSIYTDPTINMAKSLYGMADTSMYIDGWYAVAAMLKLPNGKWAIDVMRDDRATLFAAHVAEIDAVVLVTRAEHLDTAIDELGWEPVDSVAMKPLTATRIDVDTGVMLEYEELAPSAIVTNPVVPSYNHGWGTDLDPDAPAYREDMADYYKERQLEQDAVKYALSLAKKKVG